MYQESSGSLSSVIMQRLDRDRRMIVIIYHQFQYNRTREGGAAAAAAVKKGINNHIVAMESSIESSMLLR